MRYTNFHTTALCSPTRAALITGRNHHSVQTGVITEFGTGYPGYNTLMSKSNGTVDVGDTGSPVIEDYDSKMPFKFTGTLEKLTIDLGAKGLNAEDQKELEQRKLAGVIATE